MLRLPSDPLAAFRLMPESLWARSAGLRPAGRLAGGTGFALAAGGGGGGREVVTGGGACSSTYAEGTQAWPLAFLPSHQPRYEF